METYQSFTSNDQGGLQIAGVDVAQLAKEYGTPLYLMDEDQVRHACRRYRAAMEQNFGPRCHVSYASKALCIKAMYPILAQEGLWADVVSGGELYTALAAGFDPAKLQFHGNNKTEAELRYGVESGIGGFIADNREELLALEQLGAEYGKTLRVSLRVKPGVDAHTHEFISHRAASTASSASRSCTRRGAWRRPGRAPVRCGGLELVGPALPHRFPDLFDRALWAWLPARDAGLMAQIRRGSWARRPSAQSRRRFRHRLWAGRPAGAHGRNGGPVGKGCRAGLPEIRAGAALCGRRAGPQHRGACRRHRVYGRQCQAHCRRAHLCGSGWRHARQPPLRPLSAPLTRRPGPPAGKRPKTMEATIAGKCCESGDLVVKDAQIQPVEKGDLLCVFSTGAYNLLHGLQLQPHDRCPPVVFLRQGKHRLAVRAPGDLRAAGAE